MPGPFQNYMESRQWFPLRGFGIPGVKPFTVFPGFFQNWGLDGVPNDVTGSNLKAADDESYPVVFRDTSHTWNQGAAIRLFVSGPSYAGFTKTYYNSFWTTGVASFNGGDPTNDVVYPYRPFGICTPATGLILAQYHPDDVPTAAGGVQVGDSFGHALSTRVGAQTTADGSVDLLLWGVPGFKLVDNSDPSDWPDSARMKILHYNGSFAAGTWTMTKGVLAMFQATGAPSTLVGKTQGMSYNTINTVDIYYGRDTSSPIDTKQHFTNNFGTVTNNYGNVGTDKWVICENTDPPRQGQGWTVLSTETE